MRGLEMFFLVFKLFIKYCLADAAATKTEEWRVKDSKDVCKTPDGLVNQ